MTKTLPGGEFGSAWASLAAASRGRPNVGISGFGGEYADYTTRELIGNAFDCRGAGDDATADKIEAEVARRAAKKAKRK